MIKIKVITLSNIWQKDKRIQNIRKIILPKINRSLVKSKIKFDTQDLEHQILFRLMTYDKPTPKVINKVFNEQKEITLERMANTPISPDKLFVFGFNRKDNWIMKWGKDKELLYCHNKKYKKEIVFREITLPKEVEMCRRIIKDYHYIHYDRCKKGMTFGFFINGHKIPFAIEQVEPCEISHNYKKAILMLSGINYHTTVELTRFYSVPNTPKNLIGILDKLVGRVLKDRGYEWMMTSVMPAFAKTKSSTTAGGIETPLFAKKLKFEFAKRDDGKYELCVPRAKKQGIQIIKSKWQIFPVIEMVKSLYGLSPDLDKNKLYYIEK
ncbi:MAG: hypothetical protein Q8O39_00010 [bacterium]|nr:hypothetical protein [bacterium]